MGRPGRQARGKRTWAGGGAPPPCSPAPLLGGRVAGLEPAAPPRRHFIRLTRRCSRVAWPTPTWDKRPPGSVCVSFLPPTGRRELQRRDSPHPQETLPRAPAACAPASGVAWALGSAVAAVHSDGLILSRCQERPGQAWAPATCRRPAGRALAVPFPHQEASVHPLRPGEAPTGGFESFDYLIAADTKPIFLPLSILPIVANISIQGPVPVSTGASFPLFF